jgi:hypothetical protein
VQGRPGPRARSLKSFIELLTTLPTEEIDAHLPRHDFSRWIDDVFRDGTLAASLRAIESQPDDLRASVRRIAEAIRARYETSWEQKSSTKN